MSVSDAQIPDEGGDDILAAEYVLGVLPKQDWVAVGRRVETEQGFARLVDSWEVRLAPLGAIYSSVEPPPAVKASLDRRIFENGSLPGTNAGQGLWSSLAFWRGLTVAALAALALYIAVPLINPPSERPQVRLVASLASDGSDVRYLAVYDAKAGDVSLSHVAGERTAAHDFELWMIEGKNAPVSMGVIPIGSSIHLIVNDAARRMLAAGAVLAVSMEPAGGSPTGQPTGPVVAAGDLRDI